MLDGPIIGRDSPLRLLPKAMNHRQRLFFDGVRHSIAMADVAFDRLSLSAIEISGKSDAEGKDELDIPFVPSIMLDAWSVVDSIHRLRTLIGRFPRLSNFPWRKLFLRETDSTEDLRNAIQHLVGEYSPSSSRDDLPWGQLSWIYLRDDGVVRMGNVIAGALAFGMTPPTRKPPCFSPPLDQVVLSAFDKSMDISAAMSQVRKMTYEFERTWAAAKSDLGDCLPSDGMFFFDFRRDPERTDPRAE